MASGEAGWLRLPMSLMDSPVLSSALAVVTIADRTMAGLHSGCTALSSAATPVACGHDMDVPEMMLNRLYSCRDQTLATLMFSAHEASISEPGAITSGLSTVGQLPEGPRDVYVATIGAGLVPRMVISNFIAALGARGPCCGLRMTPGEEKCS
nr:unnamed protein product [Digitaria exilis]